jgi:hypothetical protein
LFLTKFSGHEVSIFDGGIFDFDGVEGDFFAEEMDDFDAAFDFDDFVKFSLFVEIDVVDQFFTEDFFDGKHFLFDIAGVTRVVERVEGVEFVVVIPVEVLSVVGKLLHNFVEVCGDVDVKFHRFAFFRFDRSNSVGFVELSEYLDGFGSNKL